MQVSPATERSRVRTAAWWSEGGIARHALVAAIVFSVLLACFAFVQSGTPHLADNDGYYHMRMAALMRSEGLRVEFLWLPLTILKPGAFYDHHMLFHAYLALFVGDGTAEQMLAGAKLASVLMPALAGLAIWWLLAAQKVPGAALWAIGTCAISHAFLYRMSMPRAQAASLLLLVLALHWLLRRRYALLLPLGFGYVWLYNAFPLLILVASIVVLATFTTERRLEWRALAYPLAGIALGIVINPYFPENIVFIVGHLAPKFGQPNTSVGSEWYPYSTWDLAQNAGGALLLWLLGALALGWQRQRMDRATLVALLLSIVFGLMLFRARRFVEYFPPFALIFAALSCAALLRELRWPGGRWAMLLVAGTLVAPLGGSTGAARLAMAQSVPASTYRAAAEWLGAHSPPGSMVFQTDWDDFPRLFFYNQHNRYLVGLDPTFMQAANPALYDEWVALTQGRGENFAKAIQNDFGATYILSDHQHRDFLRRAAHDPQMREVYRDDDAVIFAIQGTK